MIIAVVVTFCTIALAIFSITAIAISYIYYFVTFVTKAVVNIVVAIYKALKGRKKEPRRRVVYMCVVRY